MEVVMAWLGLDCMYRLIAIESSMVIKSNTSAEGDLELGVFESNLEGSKL
jgi:hypothetical protein